MNRCPNDVDDNENHGKQCNGMMVLDQESHPNWKLCCNKCNMIIRFTTKIHDITVLKERCEECGSSILQIAFNKNETPLEDGKTDYSGCILCDSFLHDMLEIKTGRNKHVSLVKRGGKGGRRGRARGKTKGEKRSVFDDMYECFLTKRLNINDN